MGWITKLRKSITHSNLLAGVLGSAAVHSTYILHPNIEANPLIYIFLFTGAWGLYITQRVMPHLVGTPELLTERHNWFSQHKYAMAILVVALGVISAIVFIELFLNYPKAFWLSAILGIIALAYGARFKIGVWQFNGLRTYGNGKIILVGIVWSALTVFLPLLTTPSTYSIQFSDFLFFLARMTVCILITIPFDIRDIQLDQHHNLNTLIGKLGVKKSAHLGAILSIIAAVIYLSISIYSEEYYYCIPAFLLVGYYYIFRFSNISGKSDAYLYWVFDSYLLYEAIALQLVLLNY